jgi:DNA primase
MLHQHGFMHSVATLGTAFTDEHAARLKRLAERVYLMFDSDAAGVRAALRAGEVLAQADIPALVVRLPEGDDPDSLLRTQGEAALQRALDAATPLARFGVEQILREVAGERNPLELEPALKAQIVERGLEWAQSLPSELDRLACLERLAPLTPAYLTSPHAALQTLQRELQRRMRTRRRARPAQPSPTPEPPPHHARPAIPKAVFQAESEILRATLSDEAAAVALQHLPEIEWQVPLHAQLATALLRLPMPPYHYTNHAELLAQIPDEPLRDLLAALLMQESPPMTEAWAAGCVQRLKEYALRRKRAPLVAELAQPTAPETAPQNDEKLQEYWRMRVESID